jgi:alpha-L-arabinofuranosidase
MLKDAIEAFLFNRRQALLNTGAAALLASAGDGAQAAIPAGGLVAAIDVTKTAPPINNHIFGAFIEHIGNLIYYSLWSEVLDDRKFYFAVDSTPLPQPQRGGFRGSPNKWTPIGPDASVAMDKVNAYVGEHSPVVTLAGSAPRGIKQDKLALMKKSYGGRIVIAGDPGARVNVTLFWGDGPGQRQSVTVPVGAEWKTQPLKFTCGGDTTAGRIEISGLGSGSFRIGAVSLMPDDNLDGFRPDTIALIKGMNSAIWRLPGGNFVSNHDWKNAVGDPDKRPTTWDYAWNAPQPNDIGGHELMRMCELIGVEPYLCINTGFGEARSGAEYLEYMNGAPTTPMGQWRARNGRPEPFKIKYWNVGNEMYGNWQLGHMSLEHYTIKHNLFVQAMRKVDPSITIIASGAMPDEMTVTRAMNYPGEVQPQVQFGSERDWTGGLLAKCYGNFDLLAEHCYTNKGQRWDGKQGKMAPVNEPVVEQVRHQAHRIRAKSEEWEEYKRRFPALRDGKVKVALDEWNQGGTGMEQALMVGMTLQEFFRHTDFIVMAAYTMGVGWLDYDRTQATLSVTGMAFDLYNRHFGRIPVALDGNAPVPLPQYPIGGDQPRQNSGSSTYPLDVSAALTTDGKALTVSVVNATDQPQALTLNLGGFKRGRGGRMWRLGGAGLQAVNKVGQPPQVVLKEAGFDTGQKKISAAPYSIEIYRFPAA